MLRMAFLLFLLAPVMAHADIVLAAKTMRAHSLLTVNDLKISQGELAGTYFAVEDLIGQETRVVLYAGRPIKIDDVGPPALVDRNQIVVLIYTTGGLSMATEGRAMARGGLGDRIRVMNLSSRSTVNGTILADGSVSVAPPQIPGS